MYNFTFIDIEFPTLSTPLTRGAEVHFSHARYEHETARVYFTNWDPSYETVSPGTPVVLNLRGARSTESYRMYVNYIKPDLSPNKKFLEVNLIGASFPFKQQSQKMWSNVTADRVVADLAKANNFSYYAVPHPRVFEQITQAGKSDWELMTELAKKCGYSLTCENTTVKFRPITQEFTEQRASANYFAMSSVTDKMTEIFSFTPLIGESIPFEDATKSEVSIGGVNPKLKSSHVYKAGKKGKYTRARSSDPIFSSYQTSVVAPTFEAVKYETEAAIERNSYPYRGVAEVIGTPGIRPGDAVYLENIGSSYSGYWTVLKVEHEIINTLTFVTTLHVGADSLGLSTSWQGEAPIYSPNQKSARILGPGKRKTNKVPPTTLVKAGKGKKQNLTNHFSKTSPKKSKSNSGATYRWEGTPVNLHTQQRPEKFTPAIVRVKKRAVNG